MMMAARVVLALMVATVVAMAAPTASKRVAVFGGGPAGTSAAHYLTKAGFSVTLFEKGERLGGKCYSLHQGDDVFEMGATILTEGYTEVLALADEFGQESKKEVGHRVMDRDTGEVSKLTTLLSNDWKISIAASTAKFFALLTRFNDWIESPSLEGADPELAMPFTQWLDSHGIKNLAPLFVIPVTTYGYDSLDVIPASYALKYLNYYNFKATLVSFGLESVGVIPPWPKILVNGYQGLVEAIATSLPDVRLNVEATSVERNVVVDGAKKIRISTRDTKTGKKEQNMLFDYLVIAFPPAAPNLKTFPMTLSADESRLLSKVQYENYFSSAVHVDGMPEDPSAVFLCWQKHQVNAPLDGTPLGFIQHGPQSDFAVVWSLPADHSFTKAQVLQKLNSTFTTVGLRLKSVDVVEQWVYFPHVASQDFVGFYDDFESKQGFGSNTYYTSGFFNFEAVEYSVRHAKYTAERIIAASRA